MIVGGQTVASTTIWPPTSHVRLLERADPVRAAAEQAYLKSQQDFLGVSVPEGRAVVEEALVVVGPLDHDHLLAVVEDLWAGPVFESRRAAVEVMIQRPSVLDVADLEALEGLIRTAGTWALVDPLAGSVVGRIVASAGDAATSATLDRWSVDESFWVRRSSMLALLLALKGDEPLADRPAWHRFCRYADTMMAEREFFIRKAIGWVLRDVAKRHPDEVRAWVEPRLDNMSGVTRREATKYL